MKRRTQNKVGEEYKEDNRKMMDEAEEKAGNTEEKRCTLDRFLYWKEQVYLFHYNPASHQFSQSSW